ncbi:MAG: glycosyltransferase [Balneolaceae bacterium]|nr:glycosyltransferase [Balneolaceae bacterium]
MKEIRNLGYQIHFAGIRFSATEKGATVPYIDKWITNFTPPGKSLFKKILNRFKIRSTRKTASKPNINNKSVDRKLRESWIDQAKTIQEKENYSRVFVPYVFNSKFLDAFGKAEVKIIDTHDIFSKRNELLEKHGVKETWFSISSEEEKRGLKRASRIIAIQEKEQQYIHELTDGEIPVHTVKHIVEKKFLEWNGSPEFNKTIGFLGSENPINVHGLTWFISEVLPDLKKDFPDLNFLIGGTICSKMEESSNYTLVGRTENPQDFYRRCLFTINPMRVGTGLKIKTIESLSYGRPVVSTSTGLDGLEEFIENGALLANTKEEFMAAITSLLNAPGKTEQLVNSMSVLIDKMNQDSRRNLELILE